MNTNANLLQTKFFYPKLPDRAIRRWRLTAALEENLKNRITLISAPAGFGKTSLLADWIQEYAHQPAWLTLDESDNDPMHFLDYVVQALLKYPSEELKSEINEHLLSTKFGPMQRLDILLNCLCEANAQVILVLDDYQHIHLSAVHDTLNYIIENLPPNVHLILATRCDPPLNLANWRAKAFLYEIRQSDLCFTDAEASAFFSHSLPFELERSELNALNAKIEGWAAGMQLAVNAMSKQKNKRDLEQFIESFKGTNRYVLEYLMEEVIKNQPAEIIEMLFYTSLLDRFCAPLCDFVLQRSDSRKIIDYLERNNLFIISLDDNDEWYRYHRLFTDLLQSQFANQDAEKVIDFHRAASLWFERNGHYAEAIDQRFLAGDTDQAALLIQDQGIEVLKRSEFFTFARWIERLPESFLYANPKLCAYYAIAMILEGRPYNETQKILHIMENLKDENEFDHSIVQVLISLIQGNFLEAIRMIGTIKALPEHEDEILQGLIEIVQSLIYEGNLESMLHQLEETHEKAQTSGNLAIAITSLSFMGDIYKTQGRLNKAWDIFQHALDLAYIGEEAYVSAGSTAFIGLGEILYKWNRLPEAEEALKTSLSLSKDWEILHFFSGLTSLARVQVAQNKFKDAQNSMRKAEELAERFDTTELDDFVVGCRIIQLKILMGQEISNSDLKHLEQSPISATDQSGNSLLLSKLFLMDIQEYTYAWALLRKNNYEKAIIHTKELLARAEHTHLDDFIIQYDVLLAVAYHKLNQHREALKYLGVALRKAKKENQIRVFLEQGPDIINLLYDAIENHIEEIFAGSLLALFPQMEIKAQKNKLQEVNGEIIEALTAREAEIIQLIAQGLSNQEIAYRLHLSISTIKVHIYNIFRKLNVHNRTQAVAKAQTLSIIS
ncbi:LuxR C-terminal-related transcriptional regulator [Pelolinea submarina]|uniref:LuxR family maltose regulon positive regulatory protein n=1 Tax=Pelolinea submarina TaxID=913107 RepID=A0A3E0AHX5_9CHLR|nr:LuxR C-terminal-related transcriptional regulator [Pelolinea submarina]REG11267.1 LuxR family maltose regulon positive regulatory protein [Pelolinea submarina]